MPVLRVLLAVLIVAFARPALAAEFWDSAQCLEAMIDHVEHLEEDITDIEDLLARIDEAERKGETERATNFRNILHSKRVDGIGSMLKRIDDVEYVYCDKSLFDAGLIARVDAARPYATETEVAVAAVEEAPAIAVTAITSTFVPYEMLEGGGCKGPFLDLAITIANTGGVYPSPVDVERRTREYPGVDWTTKSFLNLTLLIDWGAGYGQEVIPLPWGGFSGGTFMRGAIMVPYRLFVPSDKTSVRLGGWVTGASFLTVDGTATQSATYESEAHIPIWDAYTQSVEVVSTFDLEDKRKLVGAIRANIVNLGETPIPGLLEGSFSVRQKPDGPRLLVATGKSPMVGQPILAGSTINTRFKGKTYVDSSIVLLCPDGSYGTLSDGNTGNNVRTLQSSG